MLKKIEQILREISQKKEKKNLKRVFFSKNSISKKTKNTVSYRETIDMNASTNHSGFSLHAWYSSLYDNADPRIRDKFLMGQPHGIVIIYTIYYVIMAHILPRYMRHRKPYDYQRLSLYVDAVLFGLAFYFLLASSFVWLFIYDWQCEPIDPSNSWLARMAVEHCYAFLMTRIIYTVHNLPFVMGKRTNSLADYLLWHHAVFPVFVWWLINFYPGT
jgi:GNS1/SUR4 family